MLALKQCILSIALLAMLFLPLNVIANDETDKTTENQTEETQPSDDKNEKLVTNVFYDTSLRQALSDISAQTGATIIPEMSVQGIVSCEFKDTPLDKALEILLAGSGFVVKKYPDYYLIISSDPKSPSFPLISNSICVKLNYVRADTAIKLISPAFKNYVQAVPETTTNQGSNVAFTGSNVAFITAPPDIAERILADLKMIDQPPRQVMLDARIVIMERGNLSKIGIDWNLPMIQAGAFTNSVIEKGVTSAATKGTAGVKWPWGVQAGYTPGSTFTDSLLITLNLLAQNNQASIIANPQLMAQDGKEAQIKVTSEEYFEVLTQGGLYTRSQLEKIEAGTTLQITPHISDKGDITLDIKTEVSDVVARGESNLPVVTRRTSQGTVRIEDGGTAIVAGLSDERWESNQNKIPGVGDIAIIGNLFSNKGEKESSRQLAAFVTVHIVSETSVDENKTQRLLIEPVGKEFEEAIKESLTRIGKR